MSITFDIGDLDHALDALASHRQLKRVAFVIPLAPGKREMARAAIAEGPPFDAVDGGITTVADGRPRLAEVAYEWWRTSPPPPSRAGSR